MLFGPALDTDDAGGADRDAFLALMLCLGFATAMVPLMRKVAPPKAPVADGH